MALWDWLRDENNRGIIIMIGSGSVAILAGLWALYKFSRRKSDTENPSSNTTITASQGSVAVGTMHSSSVTVAPGLSDVEVDRVADRMIAKLGLVGQSESTKDPWLRKDFIAAVQRLAHDAQRGGMTAQRILEHENANDLVRYLDARRTKLDGAQESINERIEKEKIELDRELAAAAFMTGQIDQAEQALFRILATNPNDCAAINELGHTYRLRGHLQDAEDAYGRVFELSEDDEVGKAIASANLSTVQHIRGDLDGAEAMCRKALEINETLGRREGMASGYSNLGIILRTRGDLDGAEAMHRKALEIDETLGRRKAIASHLGNLGLVMQARGDLDGAETMYRKSLDIEQTLGRLEGMAGDYSNLGGIMRLRGDLVGAEAMQRKALAIYEQLGSLEGMAISYGNLGNVLLVQKNLAGAEAMFRRALEIDEQLGSREGMANQYGNLGVVLFERRDFNGAESMHRKALEIDESLGRPEGIACHYGNLGIISRARGDLTGAEVMYRKALKIHEQIGSPQGMAHDHGNLGSLLLALGDLDGARTNLTRARDLFVKLGAPQLVEKTQKLIDELPK